MKDCLIEDWYLNHNFRQMPREITRISSYLPRALGDIFTETITDIPDDCYLACPRYNVGDIQIGGTGTGKADEELEDALYRESIEELSIIPFYDEMTRKRYGRTQWAVISTLNFQVTQRAIELIDDLQTCASSRDDRSKKVGFLYWAPIEYWRRAGLKSDQAQTDNIVDVAFISKADVVKIFRSFL